MQFHNEKNGVEIIRNIDSIEAIDISLEYEGEVIFENLSFKLIKGKSCVVVGKNGAGKTSLLFVIIGLLHKNFFGEIKFNETDLSNINMVRLRREKISFMEQEPTFLEESIEKTIFWTPYYKNNIIKYNDACVFHSTLGTIKGLGISDCSGGEKTNSFSKEYR